MNEEELRPFLFESDEYGYRVNIRNPYVAKLFTRFRDKLRLPTWCPCNDIERLEFETAVIPLLEKKFGTKAPKVNVPQHIRERLPVELVATLYGLDEEFMLNLEKNTKNSRPAQQRKTAAR